MQPDHEAGYIDQKDERDMKRVAEFDEMALFEGFPDIHRSAVYHRIICDDTNHVTVETSQARD